MNKTPDHAAIRHVSPHVCGQRSQQQDDAADAVREPHPRRWWGGLADALARAELRIIAGFRVPPNGG